jgi:uncharacterized membrane protein
MSYLIALVFDDQFKGEEARASLHRMVGEGLLEMNDTVFIARKPDGKTLVSQEDQIMGRDQKIGQVVGVIAAAVTGTVPFVLAGTIAGRLIGKLTDHGITRKFIRDLKQELQPGTSGLVLLGSSDPERRHKIEERMQGFGGRIFESDLPPELQEEIEREIERQKAVPTVTAPGL